MTKYEIISYLKRKYAEDLRQKQHIFDVTMEKMQKNERFAKISKEIDNLLIDKAKLEFENKSTIELEKKLEEKNREMQLFKNDIPKIDYNCERCKDTGYLNNVFCDCFKKHYTNLLLKESGMNLSSNITFKDYNTNLQSDKILNMFLDFTKLFPNNKTKIITLIGNTGVGKTFVTECVANELINKGEFVFFTSAFNLNRLYHKYHTTFSDARESILEAVMESDLLIIDDLGTENLLKNVTLEYLLLTINERTLKNKTTIITTNLTQDAILARYGERIFSRLANKQNAIFIQMQGSDLRLKP